MTETQNADFINEINEELRYLGENQNYIVHALRISKNRLICLMNSKAKFKTDEITKIKNLLGI